MKVAGLIFSNIHDQCIPEMTRMRTIASIPFGCRYRLIDFPLSNMVNSNITNIGVITHYNYQSLMDHIGTGKDWDLARRSGGIKLLPPYVTAYENSVAGKLYENRLEALMGAANFINRCNAKYIVMSDCDMILNIDLSDVIEEHINSGAYLTMVAKEVDASLTKIESTVTVIEKNAEGDVADVALEQPKSGKANVYANILVISREELQNIVSDSMAHGYKSFTNDVLKRLLKKGKKLHVYQFNGWYSHVTSLASYFESSMALLKSECRKSLFLAGERQIYTKVRNSSPTQYAEGASVKNSLIADGCRIEGTVENCILFRGVHIGKGTTVRNCILLQDTYVGENAELNCLISDKNVVIKDGRHLSGHESMPFFIGKGQMV